MLASLAAGERLTRLIVVVLLISGVVVLVVALVMSIHSYVCRKTEAVSEKDKAGPSEHGLLGDAADLAKAFKGLDVIGRLLVMSLTLFTLAVAAAGVEVAAR